MSSLFETVIAAIYLDSGYEQAKAFILRYGNLEKRAASANYKGELQEYLQQMGEELPVYNTKKSGKDNAPVFRAEVSAMGKHAIGEGGSKREAEQEAAQALLQALTRNKK